MIDAIVAIDDGAGQRQVSLAAYLDAAALEEAAVAANAWIKSLRHAIVDGEPLRRRFTFRGESLWWFTELYLHKVQVILSIFETIASLEALLERERPRALRLVRGAQVVRVVAPQMATGRRVGYSGPAPSPALARQARLQARASWLHGSALASRLRPRGRPSSAQGTIAAFVHRAFWRADVGDGSAEAYIGPVLQAIERQVGRDALRYVSLGPRANFRARRWWDPLRGGALGAATPVEAFAPLDRLAHSRRLWRERHEMRRALWESDDIRTRSIVRGIDCWRVVREELAGVAFLQWPWSARVLDEADAALDVLRPRAVVTYAEAGGWGRALMLACRQRDIPSIGLQHGFIYRHWLNYLHEPDEMAPDPGHPEDRGFPRPSLTLVFDEHAASHLARAGRFPREALAVTGSPRLDALVRAAAALSREEIERARAAAGPEGTLLLVTTKYREAARVLPALIQAASRIPGVRLAIKTHPAETPEVYRPVAAGQRHVTVLPASAPLAPLLRACRAVVTVNSTVAVDAAVLDVPALVIGLPNNLSPFVEAGCMAGAPADGMEEALRRILYDGEFRQQLAEARRQFLARSGIGSDGNAADRAATAVIRRADVAGRDEPGTRVESS